MALRTIVLKFPIIIYDHELTEYTYIVSEYLINFSLAMREMSIQETYAPTTFIARHTIL